MLQYIRCSTTEKRKEKAASMGFGWYPKEKSGDSACVCAKLLPPPCDGPSMGKGGEYMNSSSASDTKKRRGKELLKVVSCPCQAVVWSCCLFKAS